MISFDDLVGGLVEGKGKGHMGEVAKGSAKEKIMQHLEMAKKMAEDAGIDFMAMADECCSEEKEMGDMGEKSPMPMMAEQDSEESEDEAEEDSEMASEEDDQEAEMPMSDSGKKAKMSAIIMKIKSKKA